MRHSTTNNDYVVGPAVRGYNIFKFTVLLLLLAVLIALLLRSGQSTSFQTPTLTGPAGTINTGVVTLHGTGSPNSTISIWLDGAFHGQTTVTADGTWSFMTDLASAGDYDAQAFALDTDGVAQAESTLLTLTVLEAVAATTPEPTATPAPFPSATASPPPAKLSVTTASFDDFTAEEAAVAGDYLLTGTGEPGASIELYLIAADGTILPTDTATVASDGGWQLAGRSSVPAGSYIISTSMFSPDGALLDTVDVAELAWQSEVTTPVLAGLGEDESGRRMLSGTADPFADVEIWIDGILAGTAPSDAAGYWQFSLGDLFADFTLELRAKADPTYSTGPITVRSRAALVVTEATGLELADGNFELSLLGLAGPDSQVSIYLNGQRLEPIRAAADGSWRYVGTHTSGGYDITISYADLTLAEGALWNTSQRLVLGDPLGQLQISLGGEASTASGLGVAPAGGPVVHVILDASWSMTEPLGDATRFDIARAAVADIVSQSLPDNTPIALRIFGNLVGNLACQTDLMLPYGALDRDAFNQILTDAEPQFDANTAIAASLAAVPQDLAEAAEEETIIVLLTDGEETCGGDPAAEIQALDDAGYNIVLNIVGLSIDDAALAAQFQQWATLGNGSYFAADDASSLATALADAMRINYIVRDAAENIIAIGRIGGGPIDLPPGVYTVEVLTNPRTFFTEISIAADEITSFSLTE